MRTIRGLSFFADGECFAADVTLVRKVAWKLEVTPVPAAPDEVAGIANMKGKVVTILSLAALQGRKPGAARGRLVNAVIFKPPADGADQMGLVIDRPGELVEIDESKAAPPPPAEGPEGIGHISGVYESGGTLYRILNIDSITGRFRNGAPQRAGEPRGGTVNEEYV